VLAISLDVSFCQSEVQNKNLVGSLVESDTKIIGLDVSVNEVTIVDVLDSGDHLVDQHEDGF